MTSAPSSGQALSGDRLRRSFDPLVVSRGEVYALRGAVTIRHGDASSVHARVAGTERYEVTLRHSRRGRAGGTLSCSCSCGHAQTARRLCKHVWATLRVADGRGHLTGATRQPGWLEVRATPEPLPHEDESRTEPRWLVDLPASTPYSGLVVDAYTSTYGRERPSTTFRRDTESEPSDSTPVRVAALARTGLAEVLHRYDRTPEPLAFDEGEPFRLVLVVDEQDPTSETLGALRVRGELRRDGEAIPLDEMSAVYHDGVAFVGPRALRIERDAPLRWVSALQKRGNELVIEAEDAPRFLRELVTKSRSDLFELPPSFQLTRGVGFSTRVHVRRPEGASDAPPRSLQADVTFAYDDSSVASSSDRGVLVIDTTHRRISVRDRDAERSAIAHLIAAGFSTSRSARAGVLKIAPARLTRAILALPPERFVVEADGVVHRAATTSSLSVSSGIDWFDLKGSVRFGTHYAPAPALLEAAKRGDPRVRLDDGSVGILPDEWLARVGRVLALTPGNGEDNGNGNRDAIRLRFERAQLPLVDAMLGDEGEAIAWHGPIAALRRQLGSGLDLPLADAPPGFRGELRDYQRGGLAWMQWLEGLGLSGCLADDMGLGKTVQVLALLLARKDRPRKSTTSLVVAPRSVVYNWIAEARKFAPELCVRELTSGVDEDDARAADVLVTTYGVVRRRALELAKLPFDYVVLDEAHAIKNARASTTQAVLRLRSEHRLALTGTPVENHLGELTSLFDFLNPGMFGPSLRRLARASLEIAPDEGARIGRGLRPFVLRRKKSDVLTELPARIDQTIVCEMAGAQRAIYDRVKRHYQAILRREIDEVGLDACRFHVLEALLRLRQIACHPGLVDPELAGQRSAKLDVLGELLEPIVAARKKAIVFSQFTRLLDIVEADLDARQIRHTRLDGASTDRQALVERFQNDPTCSVFLVSLKAGGVGLNLTAAEYVILLDPWWNPAAEAQAVDRAHRMGQTKNVVAYRLLCKDTIEERVAELQEKKRALASAVFGETEGPRAATLSVADVEALLW
jgi:superfamily II DNA or RNA helicase